MTTIVHQGTALQVTIATGTHTFTKDDYRGLIAKLHELLDSGEVDAQLTAQFGVLRDGNVDPLQPVNATGKLTDEMLSEAFEGVKAERDKAAAALDVPKPNRATRRRKTAAKKKPPAVAERNGTGDPARVPAPTA